MKHFKQFVLFCVCLLVGTLKAEIVNESVKRTVDLTKHIVKIRTEISLSTKGEEVSSYQVIFRQEQLKAMAKLSASLNKKKCEIKKIVSSDDKIATFEVVFPTPCSSKCSLRLVHYYTRVLTAYPEAIAQNEKQLMLFSFVHKTYLSLYPTTKDQLVFKLPSSKVESVSPKHTSRKGKQIIYGPFSNTKSKDFDSEKIKIHFQTDTSFKTVTSLVKEIEVSMWGRVSIEEVYDLTNTGAKLSHGFSRFDYGMKNHRGNSFDQLIMNLPAQADNVYYRDQIGNITTSRLRQASEVFSSRHKQTRELLLTPRFPIFGGWKTQFYMGYTLPTGSVLTVKDNKYFTLTVDFSTAMEGAAVDELKVKVIIPEGAKNVQAKVPIAKDSVQDLLENQTTRQTYLDTKLFGRPVVILQRKNLIPQHNVPFVVTFEFEPIFMLHEPLLLVGGFMTFFIIVMAVLRMDLSIATTKSPKGKSKTD